MSESKLIMVVDDEEVVRDVLCSFLEQKGYETVAMEDGLSAISFTEKKKPDLVFLDIKMPGLNGIETCYMLNLIPPLPNTPRTGIIIITGYGSPENVEKSFDRGAIDVIKKPFDLDDVNYRAKTWLDINNIENEIVRVKTYTEKISWYLLTKGIKKSNEHKAI